MSSKICLELRGLPLKSFPLIQSLGVKQYSSQEIYIVYLRQSYSCYSKLSSPLIQTNPHQLLPFYWIFWAVSLWIRTTEVAGANRYCFYGLGRDLQGLLTAFCHFHPKLVSWSPACTNCSGESIPLASKSLSEGVNLELKKLFIPSNIKDIIKTRPEPSKRKSSPLVFIGRDEGVKVDKKRPPWGLNPRPLSQEPNALPTELDGLYESQPSFQNNQPVWEEPFHILPILSDIILYIEH